jgi:hypothetical protein
MKDALQALKRAIENRERACAGSLSRADASQVLRVEFAARDAVMALLAQAGEKVEDERPKQVLEAGQRLLAN